MSRILIFVASLLVAISCTQTLPTPVPTQTSPPTQSPLSTATTTATPTNEPSTMKWLETRSSTSDIPLGRTIAGNG